MIDPEIRSAIKKIFPQITNAKQLAVLMEIIYRTLYPTSKTRINISENTLRFLAFKKTDRYRRFEVPKKSGGVRLISSPIYSLKVYQSLLNVILQSVFTAHRSSYGFLYGKSIADNAKNHIGKKYVYNIDLENFFPSIQFRRVKTVLGIEPFNLNGEKEELAFLIANLCCEKESDNDSKGFLPQGAPTSPILTNIISQRLDRKLLKIAKKNKAIYTRYADDITFSCDNNIFNDDFFSDLRTIVEGQENFKINEKKVRLQDYSSRQEVTGIIVNKKSNLSGNYVDNLRFWIFLWERFGYEKTLMRFSKDYSKEKGFRRNKGSLPSMVSVIEGKLNFLGMIRGANDSLYLSLKNKFLILNSQNQHLSAQEKEIPNILLILQKWKEKGIDHVINLI